MNAIGTHHEAAFYVAGGTLSRDALCYVTRQADADLRASLDRGEFCYVLTSRQMGKSSLMVRIASLLREEGVGVVVLDLTAIGQNLTAEQWYGGLLTQMANQLELEDELEEFWDTHTILGPLQRWTQAVSEVVLPRWSSRVVIFIDEIDAVRSLPFSTDEFFAAIREFYNRRSNNAELERLTFCLLGVAAPSDLIRDTRMTPFNIGHRLELHDFTGAEAQVLAYGLGKTDSEGTVLLNRTLFWTAGHPYLTQRLCQSVSERAAESTTRGTQLVDELCDQLFFMRHAKGQDDNLLFVRERLLRADVDIAGLLELYAQVRKRKRVVVDDEANPLITTLKLSGIIRIENGRLRPRNRIYDRVFDDMWVAENMPDAEVRRQRIAYRKGVLRAAAIAAVILITIAGTALIAVRQRNRATEEARRAEEQEKTTRRLLYAEQMNRAARDWQDSSIEHMRAMLSAQLPHSGQEDLRGFEWYLLWGLAHTEMVTQSIDGAMWFSFSPDLKMFAAGSNSDMKVGDVNGELPVRSLKSLGIAGIAEFSYDGKLMAATVENENSIKIVEVSSGRELHRMTGHSGNVTELRFSPDGRMLASSSEDRTAALWDADTGNLRAVLKGQNCPINSIAFSPDGSKVVTAGDDSTARLWDASTGHQLVAMERHPSATQPNVIPHIIRIGFSPDGARIFAVGRFMNIAVWDAATGRALPALEGHGSYASAIAFSPDGMRMATGGDDRVILLWDLKTWSVIRKLIGHANQITELRFSRDGKILASASFDGAIKLWDVTGNPNPLELEGGQLVAFSPDGKTMVSTYGAKVKVWDAIDWKVINDFDRSGSSIVSMTLSPDAKTLAIGCEDDSVICWDLVTNKQRFALKGSSSLVLRKPVEFSPDGIYLAIGSADSTLRIWDVDTVKEVARLEGGQGGILGVAFSSDSRLLAATGPDRTIRIWDMAERKLSAVLRGHTLNTLRVTFSADGRKLASTSLDSTIKLWDVATGNELFTLNGHAGAVNWAAFSPDGRRLATAGQDFTVRLWDVTTGEEMATFRRHTAPVWSVAFSPDGGNLVSAGRDGTMRIWRAGK